MSTSLSRGGAVRFAISALVASALLTVSLRADLLVLNSGSGGGRGGSPAIFRFDPTGARLGVFGHETEAYYAMTLTAAGELFVNANTLGDHELDRFDLDGNYLGSAASAPAAFFSGMLRGPDGQLYSLMRASDFSYEPGPWHVVRFEGSVPKIFIPSGRGGMTAPVTMLLGTDGRLYVADTEAGILRFDAATGEFIDVFVPNGSGGMPRATRMAFGPDGQFYVSSEAASAVYRFDGVSGAFIDEFVAAASGGLGNPCGLAFGPDNDLYVVSRATGQVLRFHGASGEFVSIAAADTELRSPVDLAFTPAPAAIEFATVVPAEKIESAVQPSPFGLWDFFIRAAAGPSFQVRAR